jgi:serine/threonine-protein kinase
MISKRSPAPALAYGDPRTDTEPVTSPLDPASVSAEVCAASGPLPVRPGDCLGDYRILAKLGEGGMGVVYKALDQTLRRTVALKLLSPQLISGREFLERFHAEARIQARLTGRNIVTLHSLFQAPPGLVLVMEYVEGETLADYLHRRGRLRLEQALRIFAQALRGVERAHRQGVIHCDLKPGNIFLTSEGEIKLMDFGLARLVGGDRIAAHGAVLGTLRYIAPEQIQRRKADPRSDLYALGISLYEAVAGRPPFDSASQRELLLAHLEQPAPPPSRFATDLPAALDAVVLRAIEKDPDRRYQSASEFRAALQVLGENPDRPAPLGRRRTPLMELFGVAGSDRDTSGPTTVSSPFTYARSRTSDEAPAGRPAARQRRSRIGWLFGAIGLYLAAPAALVGLLLWSLPHQPADEQSVVAPLQVALKDWTEHFRASLSPRLSRQPLESDTASPLGR